MYLIFKNIFTVLLQFFKSTTLKNVVDTPVIKPPKIIRLPPPNLNKGTTKIDMIPTINENPPLLTTKDRQRLFGKFKHRSANNPTDKEAIEIIDNWENENIIRTYIPQLKDVKMWVNPDGTIHYCNGYIHCHKLIEKQLLGVFNEIEEKGYKNLILNFGGCYVPRYIRGQIGNLSSHAFGSAIDINTDWNGLGDKPAKEKEMGTVVPLVPIFKKYGFAWGGLFNRIDAMHFEVQTLYN